MSTSPRVLRKVEALKRGRVYYIGEWCPSCHYTVTFAKSNKCAVCNTAQPYPRELQAQIAYTERTPFRRSAKQYIELVSVKAQSRGERREGSKAETHHDAPYDWQEDRMYNVDARREATDAGHSWFVNRNLEIVEIK